MLLLVREDLTRIQNPTRVEHALDHSHLCQRHLVLSQLSQIFILAPSEAMFGRYAPLPSHNRLKQIGLQYRRKLFIFLEYTGGSYIDMQIPIPQVSCLGLRKEKSSETKYQKGKNLTDAKIHI